MYIILYIYIYIYIYIEPLPPLAGDIIQRDELPGDREGLELASHTPSLLLCHKAVLIQHRWQLRHCVHSHSLAKFMTFEVSPQWQANVYYDVATCDRFCFTTDSVLNAPKQALKYTERVLLTSCTRPQKSATKAHIGNF